jgi:hypothetical protein
MRPRYRKRLNFGPLRINLSRSGVGASLGVRGFRVTQSSTGRRFMTLTLPGTGLSWQKILGRRSQRAKTRNTVVTQPPSPPPPSSSTPSPTLGSSSAALGNGVPWWQQSGIQKGP